MAHPSHLKDLADGIDMEDGDRAVPRQPRSGVGLTRASWGPWGLSGDFTRHQKFFRLESLS